MTFWRLVLAGIFIGEGRQSLLVEVHFPLHRRQDIQLGMLFIPPENIETFSFMLWLPDAAIGKLHGVRGKSPAQHGLLLRRWIRLSFQRLLLARRDRFFPCPEMSLKRTVQ